MALCLAFHAGYRCRHAGACCKQDWHIPVEAQVVELAGALGWAGLLEAGAPLPRHPSGACVFFDADGGRLCRIHAAAGPEALPSGCRHFPRVVLRDDRGTFISLSHFCPTAAAMLVEHPDGEAGTSGSDDGLRIVEAPPALDIGGLDGFEARGALPPLLRPGILTDLDGYQAWERAAIATFARADLDAAQALDVIAAATRRVRKWIPGTCALSEAVAEAFDRAPDKQSFGSSDLRIPGEAPGRRPVYSRAAKRYLAARLFAAPIVYEAQGLLTVVEWLRTCLAALEQELGRGADDGDVVDAVRRTDLIVVHQTDTRAFAHSARAIEGADS